MDWITWIGLPGRQEEKHRHQDRRDRRHGLDRRDRQIDIQTNGQTARTRQDRQDTRDGYVRHTTYKHEI